MATDDWYNFSISQWYNDTALSWFQMVLDGSFYDKKDFFVAAIAAYVPSRIKSVFHTVANASFFAPANAIKGTE